MALADKTDAEIWQIFIDLILHELVAAHDFKASDGSRYADGMVDGLRHLKVHAQMHQLAATSEPRMTASIPIFDPECHVVTTESIDTGRTIAIARIRT